MPIPDEVWDELRASGPNEVETVWVVVYNGSNFHQPMYFVGPEDGPPRHEPGRDRPQTCWSFDLTQALHYGSDEEATRAARRAGFVRGQFAVRRRELERRYEPQEEETEVEPGRVPTVQAPQEARIEEVGEAEAQPDPRDGQIRRRTRPRAAEDQQVTRVPGEGRLSGPEDEAYQEAARQRRRKDPPRKIDVTVTGCMSCPFLHHLQVDVKIEEHAVELGAGWYCYHPKNRHDMALHQIATEQMVNDSPDQVLGLRDWLAHHEGSSFSHVCPLPKPKAGLEPRGGRMLDVG